MTQAIAHFMQQLQEVWDEHRQALLARRELPAALKDLTAEPSILHLPARTGATGRPAVERFYAEEFLPHLPAGLAVDRISRTADRWRLVDETMVSFTHDRELPWLLPGVRPTNNRAEVLAITVVAFDRTRIGAVRVLWDYATLTAQLGLPGAYSPSSQRPGAISLRA